jgi:hypothetical protein
MYLFPLDFLLSSCTICQCHSLYTFLFFTIQQDWYSKRLSGFLLFWLFNDAVNTETIVLDGRMINESGAVNGMKADQITWRNPTPVPFCPS